MPDSVLRQLQDGVAVISLNRPERHNAINDEMSDQLSDAVGWAVSGVGLIDFVHAAREVDGRAMERACHLAAGPPLALACIKQTVDSVWSGVVDRGLRMELLAQSYLFTTSDSEEARAASAGGRPPCFDGR